MVLGIELGLVMCKATLLYNHSGLEHVLFIITIMDKSDLIKTIKEGLARWH